jgi:GR25 family glycosyltransferase involved in LPS biosynthesis
MKLIIILFVILLIILYYKYYKSKELFENGLLSFDDINIYVLYIEKREEYIKNIINSIFKNPIFVKGIDKNILTKEQLIKDNIIKNDIKNFNQGRVACHLGHINILKQFINSNKKYAIIFEDDIYIENIQECKKKLNKIIRNIPKDAEIVYLSYCWENCYNAIEYNYFFDKSYNPRCRHFYLVSQEGARKIIDNTLPMYMQGDVMIGLMIRNKELISYNLNSKYLSIKQNREKLGTNLNNYGSLSFDNCRKINNNKLINFYKYLFSYFL